MRDTFERALALRIDAVQVAAVRARVASVSDDDLPERDRRTRSETLTLRGEAQVEGADLVYDGYRECTLIGRGRGVDWWLIAWADEDDGGAVIYCTAHESRLSRPEARP